MVSNIREFKGKSLLTFLDTYIVLDLETTGLSPNYDEIIEIGALKVVNNIITDTFHTLVKPEYPIDEFITELTGISNDMVKNAPSINQVLPNLLSFTEGFVIIGHYVHFDINFLYDKCLYHLKKPFSNDLVDTIRISRHLNKELKSHKLSKLVEHYNIINKSPHRSLGDCEATYELYNKLRQQANSKDIIIEKLSHYNLKANEVSTDNEVFDETHPLYDKTCVFTGKLDSMPRKTAMQYVVDLGGHCGDNVTKETDFLILGDLSYCSQVKGEKSSKMKKAEKMRLNGYDIQVLSESVFYDLIEL